MQCLYVCAAQLLSPFRCPVRDSQSTYIPRVRRKGRLEGFCEGLYTTQNAYAVSPGRRKRYRILSRDAMGHETGMEAIGTGHLVQQVVWWRGRGDHHRAIGPRDQYSHGLKDGSSTGRSTRSTRLASGASRRPGWMLSQMGLQMRPSNGWVCAQLEEDMGDHELVCDAS